MKTLLLFIFIEQCVSFSLTDYMTHLDCGIVKQIIYPNISDHNDLMVDIEVFNDNFLLLVEKIQEHEDDEIKHFVKLFRMSKGPVFMSQMIVKNIFITFYNWTEDEFAYLEKCVNDTYKIRASFYEAYANNTEWLQTVDQENSTLKELYNIVPPDDTTEEYSEESAINFTSEFGPGFRPPPYKRGKPFIPITMSFV